MAPVFLNSDADDDFVRTISDNDDAFPLPGDEDGAEIETCSKPAQKRKKRKREVTEETIAKSSSGQKEHKKQKNLNGSVEKQKSNGDGDKEQEEETWDAQGEDDGAMDSDFDFQIGAMNTGVMEEFDGWGEDDAATRPTAQKSGDKKGVDIDELIARRRRAENGKKATNRAHDHEQTGNREGSADLEEDLGLESSIEEDHPDEEEDETLAADAFGMGAPFVDSEDDKEEAGSQEDETESEEEEEAIADAMPNPEDLEDVSEEEADQEELAKRKAFFAPEEPATKSTTRDASAKSFQSMSLSRPILRGLASVGFASPTPIQNKTIPAALLGKDVVGGAVTGSGKTGAFIIPILERLLYRPKKVPTSRVAILMPTRELAVQCFNVSKKLASFTDITFALLTGGFSLREQESVLRSRPDVLIATPGRFIDHMRNSASFTIDTLEILVLDEADRMLEDGFADELNEILTTIPKSRQTMLFSATMTDRVDKLIRVGLNRPVRLMVDARKQTVVTLTQEFVRLRPGREGKRLGYLMHLCSDVFSERVIIFFRQKKEAHRVRIIFGLLGIKAAELHGSMSQEQRIASLTSFRNGHCTHLLATDLASRGLDIPNVSVVLNFEAPQSHEIYLHRVGRTARAGRGGRACTIAAESDRRVVKQAVKAAKAQGAKIVSRVVDLQAADQWAAKAAALDEELKEILKDEKEEKLLSLTDMVLRKGENIMEHEDEIHARPKRTWFESEKEKLKAKKAGQEELNGWMTSGKKVGGKLSNKEKKALDDKRERKQEGRAWKKGKGDANSRGKEKGGTKGKNKDNGGREGRGGAQTGVGDSKRKGGRGGMRPKR